MNEFTAADVNISLSLMASSKKHGFLTLSNSFKEQHLEMLLLKLADPQCLAALNVSQQKTKTGKLKHCLSLPSGAILGWLSGSQTPKLTLNALLTGELEISEYLPSINADEALQSW